MANPADVALILSRTSFFPTQARVQELSAMDWNQVVAMVVDQAARPQVGVPPLKNIYLSSEFDDYIAFTNFEIQRLADPSLGLGDRMLWFWHGLLTSSWDKVFETGLLVRQHQLLAKYALGNFRHLMYQLTVDAAMVFYLDLAFSRATAPNENYAREVMELFMLGRGNYTQDDVKAAALGFAGFTISGYPQTGGATYNPDNLQVQFDGSGAYAGPLNYLGQSLQMDGGRTQYQKIIDAILNLSPSPGVYTCAEYIVTRLFRYFVHSDPDPATITSLATTFRNSNYEILPVLSALFRLPDFLTSRGARARQPMETILLIVAGFGARLSNFDFFWSYLFVTGQQPFNPPNVAGWPLDDRWLSASQVLARANMASTGYNGAGKKLIKQLRKSKDPVTLALNAMSIYNASDATIAVMTQAAATQSDPQARGRLLLTLAALSPEFALS